MPDRAITHRDGDDLLRIEHRRSGQTSARVPTARRRFGGRSVIVLLILLLLAAILPAGLGWADATVTDIADPNSVTCGESGLIDFENLPDQTDLSPTVINGVHFTTTGGFTWRVGDFATGSYNGKYPAGNYTSRGTHWAWLGENQGAGRLDFVGGSTSYVSLLVSANTPVVLEGYNSSGVLLETTGAAPSTIGTGHMTELKISRPAADMSYVIVHDSGNYFIVDAICTNAPGVGSIGRYVALGDSYSSGEGVPPFQSGSDTSQDSCHRSTAAYPELITGRFGIPQAVEHWACSGSQIKDFYSTNHANSSEPSQQTRLAPDVSLLTFGVGGNDIGFAGIATACVKTSAWLWFGNNQDYDPHCRQHLAAQTASLIKQLKDGLPGSDCGGAACSLPKLYSDLRKDTPKAERVVVGYPNFLPAKATGACKGSIKKNDGSDRGQGAGWQFSKDDTLWLHGVITSLNDKIRDAAQQAGFIYVDINELFDGHEVCSDDPWLNGVVLTDDDKSSPYSFHPNAAGQKVMADAIWGRITLGASDLYIRPGETRASTYAVAEKQNAFTATTRWTGSDMGLTLTSPSGRVIDRETTDADVVKIQGQTEESFTVVDPEAGDWTVDVTGLDVPDVGEAVRLELDQHDDAGDAPLATIAATPDRGVGPVEVQLDGTASGVQYGAITGYSWTFDDGTSPAAGGRVTHSFTKPGTHSVGLTVTDSAGRTNTTSQNIFVGAQNQAPLAQLFDAPNGGVAPLAVQLTAGDSTDADGTIVSYRWDFDGDGTVDLVTATPETSHVYKSNGAYTPAVTVVDDLGGQTTVSGSPVSVDVGREPGTLVSLTPARIADSRSALQIPNALAALATARVKVTGNGGVPEAGVSAVVLNVTAVRPQRSGYVTVWPSGVPRTPTSNLNFAAGQNIPNTVIVPVGADGQIRLFNGSSGSVDLLVDVSGYIVAGMPVAAGAVTPLTPARVADSRSGLQIPAALTALQSVTVQLSGRGGVPPTGASAVVLNVTAVKPQGSGYITAWPWGIPRTPTSNLNFTSGQDIPNTVIVPLASNGKIQLYNGSHGTVQLLVDVTGYVVSGSPTATGALASLTPARIADSRSALQIPKTVAALAAVPVQITGKGGVPSAGVSSVVINVTAVNPHAAGYVTVWPSGIPRTGTSNLNFSTAGQSIPNVVVVPVGADGKIRMFNGSAGAVDLIVDVSGYTLSGG